MSQISGVSSEGGSRNRPNILPIKTKSSFISGSQNLKPDDANEEGRASFDESECSFDVKGFNSTIPERQHSVDNILKLESRIKIMESDTKQAAYDMDFEKCIQLRREKSHLEEELQIIRRSEVGPHSVGCDEPPTSIPSIGSGHSTLSSSLIEKWKMYPEEDKYCKNCGRRRRMIKLRLGKFCEDCGYKFYDKEKEQEIRQFCSECGVKRVFFKNGQPGNFCLECGAKFEDSGVEDAPRSSFSDSMYLGSPAESAFSCSPTPEQVINFLRQVTYNMSEDGDDLYSISPASGGENPKYLSTATIYSFLNKNPSPSPSPEPSPRILLDASSNQENDPEIEKFRQCVCYQASELTDIWNSLEEGPSLDIDEGSRVIEKFENQRFYNLMREKDGTPRLRQWGASSPTGGMLSYFDHPSWSDRYGNDMSNYRVPDGWKWGEAKWKMLIDDTTDQEGWLYAFGFDRKFTARYGKFAFVRKRKYSRTLKKIEQSQ